MESGVFLHSPFSEANIVKGNNRSLLLQFLLTQIFLSKKAQLKKASYEEIYSPITSSFYPLDWSSQRGCLNKACEHMLLLSTAFPTKLDAIALFKHSLINTTTALTNHLGGISEPFELQLSLYLKQLYLTLEPLILECKDDENLWFFLLQHQEIIEKITHSSHLLSFLQKNVIQGIDDLCKLLCDKFHARGFAFLIPQVKALVQLLKNCHE
jgi:hypothetical protein